MPRIEFVGQSAKDSDNGPANTSRLINCYRQVVAGRTARVLKSVLGTTGFADLPGVFMRAMHATGGYVHVAHGGNLLRVSSEGGVQTLGAIEDDVETFVSSNNGLITVAAGGNYYVWNGVLSLPANVAFDRVGDCLFMNQRTVLIEENGRRVQWSAVADASDLDAADVATTEQEDDLNLRGFQVGGQLWIFKETSIERWRNTATGFSYIPGSKIDRGLKARRLAVAVPGGVFFVGDDNRAYIAAAGGISSPVSTIAVETAIKQGTPTNCFYFPDEGSEFYVIRFSDRPAWCLNLQTGEWNERATGEDGPWDVVETVRAFDTTLGGTDLGGLYRFDRVNSDVSGSLIRTAVGNTIYNDSNRFNIPQFELRGRVGRSSLDQASVGVVSTKGLALDAGGGFALQASPVQIASYEASLTLEVSRDYGETWGYPKVRPMGAFGEYNKRMVFRALGRHRAFTPRVRVSDPEELTLDAEAIVRVS